MNHDDTELWSKIIEEQDDWRALHINCFSSEACDLQKLLKHPEFDTTSEIWLEHWRPSGALRDDYRPWFAALAERPLPALRSLTIGGYSDRSIDAHLGSAAGLAPVLAKLERLILVGDGSELVPLRAPALRQLGLELGGLPEPIARRLLLESELPSLTALQIRLRDMSEREPEMASFGRIAALCERTDISLERLTLSGVTLSKTDFARLLESPVTARLRLLDLSGGCTLKGGLATMLAARDRLAEVIVVPPQSASTEALTEGGFPLARTWREARALLAPAVPSRW